MQNWIDKRIENATWLRFLIYLVGLMAYSAWAFRSGGEFATALAAAGGDLPEMTPGFPKGLAETVYANLGDAVAQYSVFQAIDIPYAIFNTLALTSATALALKRFHLGASVLRYALFPPVLYLLAELIENPLLVALANGEPGAPAFLIPVQQLATNLKWGASTLALGVALLSLAALVIAAVFSLARRNKTS